MRIWKITQSLTAEHFFSAVIFQMLKILLSIQKDVVPVTQQSLVVYQYVYCYDCGGGGGTTRPLPRDGGVEELRGDPTVGPHPKVWTIDQE